jgi:uncharacterized delta-60 repeat protein
LARCNADGSLDQSFGTGGKVITHFPGVFNTGSTATCVALQSDGKLVVGGTYKNERTPHQFALARYNSNGTLDATFGQTGKVMTFIGGRRIFFRYRSSERWKNCSGGPSIQISKA